MRLPLATLVLAIGKCGHRELLVLVYLCMCVENGPGLHPHPPSSALRTETRRDESESELGHWVASSAASGKGAEEDALPVHLSAAPVRLAIPYLAVHDHHRHFVTVTEKFMRVVHDLASPVLRSYLTLPYVTLPGIPPSLPGLRCRCREV